MAAPMYVEVFRTQRVVQKFPLVLFSRRRTDRNELDGNANGRVGQADLPSVARVRRSGRSAPALKIALASIQGGPFTDVRG
jgi:hypothetical protein